MLQGCWNTLLEISGASYSQKKQSGSSTSWEIIEIHCVISQLENRWVTIWEDFGEVLQHLGNLKEIFQSL
jgi:hypothetical protein